MKEVFIGDIHGLDLWKKVVNDNPDADKFIFVGDYFDSFDISVEIQANNFLDIIEFKKSNPDKVILLIGNHDHHYLKVGETYSGYNAGGQYLIREVLENNLHLLQICYKSVNKLVTHAGISQTWLDKHFDVGDYNKIESVLNEAYKENKRIFNFAGWDPYGNSKEASPIWIRPKALTISNRKKALRQFIQIVGHTRQSKIDLKSYDKVYGGKIILIDSLENGEYLLSYDNKLTVGYLDID